MIDKLPGGKYLDKLGEIWGVKRRWFGLEPDFLYRKRVAAKAMAWARRK